jgi:hypothetical protein
MAGGFVVVWAIGMGYWAALNVGVGPAVEELSIPPGTAAALADGRAGFFPASISLPPGGRLRVRNGDSVEHTIGNATIPPGALADISAPERGSLICTVHPSGSLAVRTDASSPWVLALLPALVLGAPLGLGLGAALRVLRRLDTA